MPSIRVQIEWDWPDDPNWLNKYNVELVLAEYCPNTAFTVTDIVDAAPDLLAALKNIRDTIDTCYVAGGWVPLDAEEMIAISELSNNAIAKARGHE